MFVVLSGTLPASLLDAFVLKDARVVLSDNNLAGPLPDQWGSNRTFAKLLLDNNWLTGTSRLARFRQPTATLFARFALQPKPFARTWASHAVIVERGVPYRSGCCKALR
jgi:hypothetical protein